MIRHTRKQLHVVPCPHRYLSYFDLLLYLQAVPRILDGHIQQPLEVVWSNSCSVTEVLI